MVILKKVKKKAPKDGVHRRTHDGYIRSPYIGVVDGNICFFGKDSIYIPKLKQKVFYSVVDKKSRSLEFVRDSMDKTDYLNRLGLCKKRTSVILHTDIDNIDCYCFCIEHVNYNIDNWIKYCIGYPYVFGKYNHTQQGYHDFVAKCKSKCGHIPISYKFGDVGYDEIEKRWYLLDTNYDD